MVKEGLRRDNLGREKFRFCTGPKYYNMSIKWVRDALAAGKGEKKSPEFNSHSSLSRLGDSFLLAERRLLWAVLLLS